jgi:hypothetical protein
LYAPLFSFRIAMNHTNNPLSVEQCNNTWGQFYLRSLLL